MSHVRDNTKENKHLPTISNCKTVTREKRKLPMLQSQALWVLLPPPPHQPHQVALKTPRTQSKVREILLDKPGLCCSHIKLLVEGSLTPLVPLEL
jgi:hypothetical protein